MLELFAGRPGRKKWRRTLIIIQSRHRLAKGGGEEIAIEARDEIFGNFLRAGGGAFVLVGAIAKAGDVHGADHSEDAPVFFRLALGEGIEMDCLGGDEEHGARLFAGGHAGAAPDAGGRIERAFGVMTWNGQCVGLGRRPGARGNEAAGLDDAIEGTAIDDEVFDDGKRPGAKRFDDDRPSIGEIPHVELAGGDPAFSAVGLAIDCQRAHPANPLTTIVVEGNRVIAGLDQPFVDNVEHFEKRALAGDPVGFVFDKVSRRVPRFLPPDFEGEIHDGLRR
jgi:hypothetical protein